MGVTAPCGPHQFVLRAARLLWRLDAGAGPVCLGAARRRSRLAALYPRPLGEYRPRLVLGIERAVRLGDLPLRPLGLLARRRLVLGSWNGMGAGLGRLARLRQLSRLGAAAAGA